MTYTVFNFQRALAQEFDSPYHILNCVRQGQTSPPPLKSPRRWLLPIAGVGAPCGNPSELLAPSESVF